MWGQAIVFIVVCYGMDSFDSLKTQLIPSIYVLLQESLLWTWTKQAWSEAHLPMIFTVRSNKGVPSSRKVHDT